MEQPRPTHPRAILFAGPSGAGKSTIARALASLLPKSALIHVDHIRAMPINGWLDPLERTPESTHQMMLAVRNTCALVHNFVDEGFTPIIDDVISRKERLDAYLHLLAPFNPVVFLLLPDRRTIQLRDALREPAFRVGKRALELHDILSERNRTERRWIHIDSSNKTSLDTLMDVVSHLEQRKTPLVPNLHARIAQLAAALASPDTKQRQSTHTPPDPSAKTRFAIRNDNVRHTRSKYALSTHTKSDRVTTTTSNNAADLTQQAAQRIQQAVGNT